MTIDNKPIVHQLTDLITKGNAHVTFEKAVENISFKNIVLTLTICLILFGYW